MASSITAIYHKLTGIETMTEWELCTAIAYFSTLRATLSSNRRVGPFGPALFAIADEADALARRSHDFLKARVADESDPDLNLMLVNCGSPHPTYAIYSGGATVAIVTKNRMHSPDEFALYSKTPITPTVPETLQRWFNNNP